MTNKQRLEEIELHTSRYGIHLFDHEWLISRVKTLTAALEMIGSDKWTDSAIIARKALEDES